MTQECTMYVRAVRCLLSYKQNVQNLLNQTAVQRHVKSMHISILRVYCVYAACILLYAFLPLCMVHHYEERH